MSKKIKDAYDTFPAKMFMGLEKRRKRWPTSQERKRKRKLREYLESQTRAGMEQTYREYLHSDRWKGFRRQILLERGTMCERCGKRDRPVTVHHLTYVRLGNELPEDVKVYCWPCHQLMHPDKREAAHARSTGTARLRA